MFYKPNGICLTGKHAESALLCPGGDQRYQGTGSNPSQVLSGEFLLDQLWWLIGRRCGGSLVGDVVAHCHC